MAAKKTKRLKVYGQNWEWFEDGWKSAYWENTTGRNRVNIYPPGGVVPHWRVHLYFLVEDVVSREYLFSGKNARARAFAVAKGLINQRRRAEETD